MWVVVTCAAGEVLPRGFIAALGRHLRAPADRLGASGVQFRLTDAPPDLGAWADEAEALALDLNILPEADRRKRILIADMDSTIIGVECIDEIADFAGVKPQVAAITERAMQGEIGFEDAFRARIALIRGLEASALARVYDERVRLNPGARVLVRTMAALGATTALVSGGFSFFTERVAAAAGFAEHRANGLDFRDGRLTGEVVEPILGQTAKRAALDEIAARLGVTAQAALAVGDGANDLAMVAAAGLGVAYRAKPALAARADARIRHSDLTALLYLQGISETEFQT